MYAVVETSALWRYYIARATNLRGQGEHHRVDRRDHGRLGFTVPWKNSA